MPNETTPPEGIEISKEVIKEGTVKFMSPAAFKNPAPVKLKRILSAIKYFCAGLVTAVGATDLFTGLQAKVIMFCLGIIMLVCGAIEYSTGVQSNADAQRELDDK